MPYHRSMKTLLALLVGLAWLEPGAHTAHAKPNIVYIMADELGYYELSCMGNPNIQTPQIDRLAAEGMRFTQALAGSSVCAPTRACLMTGKHSGHTSVRSNGGGTPLRAREATIASVLKQAGYATGGFGKWGCGGRGSTGVPEAHGFDLFLGYYDQVHAHSYYPPYIVRNSQEVHLAGNHGRSQGETYSHYVIFKAALDFIRQNRNGPFFCYLPITPPHGIFDIPDADPAWALYRDKDWPEQAKRYAAMVSMVDRQVGELRTLLKELGLLDNTIIFFCGDNGGADYFRTPEHERGFHGANVNPITGVTFRGRKGNLYEGGLRIPMIVNWPNRIPKGRVSELLWYFPDVMPTLAELAGAQVPLDIDGMSIVPELLGEQVVGCKQAQHEYLYWELGAQTALRMGQWKAIQPGKNRPWELYDLGRDISEQNDLAALKPDVLARMKAHARAAHEPVREGVFHNRAMHERDRQAKFGNASAPESTRKINALPTRGLVPQKQMKYDVVVYGGTSAGVIAAVQAARMGKSVIIVCPDKHLGGLSSGGLGWTDTGNKKVIGGLSREFYHRIWQHYQEADAWPWQQRSDYGNRGQGTPAVDGKARTMWIFEPHAAEQVFEDLIAEHAIVVHRDQWLKRPDGVGLKGRRIASVTMLSGRRYQGKMFIDATYEGDLMAGTGISYHVGREANQVYKEKWNGVQKDARHHQHYFKQAIDPYIVPGDPDSGLLPRISPDPPGENGQGDERIQAYCFRMCLSRHPQNRVPFAKPPGYDPAQYELYARVLASGWREVFGKFDPIPNLKTDTNNHGPFSTDNIGMNYDYPEASYQRRREIIVEHETYQKGLMYFLAHDARVPQEVRQKMAQWGLAKDEFTDNGHWPHQLYVREARRMVGEYVMTERDCSGRFPVPHPVGMGSYTMDSHNVQRYVTAAGTVQNEGDVGVRPQRPYQIAYESLIPKSAECENLLVPVCLSSSHIAYGSIRMEPVFMILGQSAATGACLALDAGVAVQALDYTRLRADLLADGQVLE